MNKYKVLVEFELADVKQEVGAEIEMEADLAAPLVEAGNLEAVVEKTEAELQAEAEANQVAADLKAKAEADAAAAAVGKDADAGDQGNVAAPEPRLIEVLDDKGTVKETFTAEKNGPDFVALAKNFANANGWKLDLK